MELDLRAVVWLLWKPYLERKPRQKQTKIRRGPSRDPAYRAWIRTLPCTICGAVWRVEAAHTGCDGGMSMKPSDYSCIPLCRNCHTVGRGAYHHIGKLAFEQKWGIDCVELVRELNIAWTAKKSYAHEDAPAEERNETLEPAVSFVEGTPIPLSAQRETGNSDQQKEVA